MIYQVITVKRAQIDDILNIRFINEISFNLAYSN